MPRRFRKCLGNIKNENIAITIKWPSFIAKTEKMYVLRRTKLGRIDFSFNVTYDLFTVRQ
jgi:hypothetical protein